MAVKDSIERNVILQAPRERVWKAITSPGELAKWFGTLAEFEALEVGAKIRFGWNEEVYDGEITNVEPMTRFAYRWRSYSSEIAADYPDIPATQVTFTLTDVEGGTHLHLTETGFAVVPEGAWKRAYDDNDWGWSAEMTDLQAYIQAEAV